jgi:hypothetical protein
MPPVGAATRWAQPRMAVADRDPQCSAAFDRVKVGAWGGAFNGEGKINELALLRIELGDDAACGRFGDRDDQHTVADAQQLPAGHQWPAAGLGSGPTQRD